jgi:3-hydroxybutyryl-CoA dehydrogenase
MTIKTVGVVGSGIMGSGIAQVAALSGHQVVVRSRTQGAADALMAELDRSLGRRVAKGKCTEKDHRDILGRVSATVELDRLADVDLVIETVVEDLGIKRQLFGALDRICRDDALLTTNTSTLPVVQLAMATGRPERVCGLHFFNPAPVMSLVEVVRPLTAADETMAEVHAFVEACGKRAVEVADRAGFVVNALLFPYLNHAVRLLEGHRATKEGIDAAMQGGCGFPMGPFAVLDLVGLDTSVAILDALYQESRDPNDAAAPLLRRMVAAGQLGRKSGAGFYRYET